MKNWIAPIILLAGLLACLLATRGDAPTQEAEESFAEATAFFNEGKYEDAENRYRSLIEDDQTSPAVFYNLALTQEALEKPGSAILNLERAIVLDPGSTEIQTKLAELRKNSGSMSPPPPLLWGFISTHWCALGTLLVVLLFALIPLSRLFKFPFVQSSIVIVFCLIVFRGSRNQIKAQERYSENRAIVIASDTSLRVSPFEGAAAQQTLPAGQIVRPEDKEAHEGYQLVKTDEGLSGWLKTSEFEALADW